MNDAEYMGLDVHRAMIAVAVLGAAVCAALAKCKEQISRQVRKICVG